MKKIDAIIQPAKAGDVVEALKKAGNTGIMITELEGYGRQGGIEQQFRGKTYKTEFLPKARIEIIVKDADLGKIVKIIRDAAYTGKEGDGKIFIYDVEDIMRIRTGESGDKAI
jgi:nitrogen regulatory protein P-II 1